MDPLPRISRGGGAPLLAAPWPAGGGAVAWQWGRRGLPLLPSCPYSCGGGITTPSSSDHDDGKRALFPQRPGCRDHNDDLCARRPRGAPMAGAACGGGDALCVRAEAKVGGCWGGAAAGGRVVGPSPSRMPSIDTRTKESGGGRENLVPDVGPAT
jgi:hypothetical protein